MPLNETQQTAVLNAARALIGTPYKDLDCSHFVHLAYATAELHYAYQATAKFHVLSDKQFVELKDLTSLEAADVLMFQGHMGLWDPDGCQVLQASGTPDKECRRFDNTLPFLSSRSGGGMGPEFGALKWFGKLKKVYRWK